MRNYLIPLMIALLLLTIGCSGSGNNNPVQPDDVELRIPEFNEGHTSLGVYNIEIDSSSGKIYSTLNRTVSPHYNITSFISDPACPDSQCLYLWLYNIDPEENIFYLDLYLMNPTGLSPWDPRVIFLTSLFPDDFEIVNADSWTRLFDPDDEFPNFVNPFIAMGKDDIANRRLLPYPYWEMEEVWIWINPEKDESSYLSYILEVNWPNHCREPYEINNIQFLDDEVDEDYMGKLYTTAELTHYNQFTIACDVWDWQDDVYEVSCYSPSVIGDEDWHLMFPDPSGPPERWFYTSEEINDVDEGYYEFWFRAASDEPTHQVNDLYQRFNFPVYHFDGGGLGGTGHKDAVIAFLRDTDGYSDIYIRNFYEGGTTYKLVDWPETEEYCPTIGWDGNEAFVVFSSDRLGQIDLWRIDIDGDPTSLEQLTNDEFGDFGACMNPGYPNNSNASEVDLVFYSYRDSDYAEIYAMDLDEPYSGPLPDVIRLTENYVDDIDPCIYQGSSSFTVLSWASNYVAWDNFEIYAQQYTQVYPLPTSGLLRLSYDPEDDIHPTWSNGRPIGSSDIVWSSKRNGDFDLYKYEVATGYVLPVLEEGLDRDQVDPCFSPNGNQIIFAWDDDEYFNLWSIPWDGNTDFLFPRTINNKDEWAPSWGWRN